METINRRLADILFKEMKLTSSEIARNIESTPQSVDGWLKGKGGKFVMPSAENVAKICATYGINPIYILTGKGEKHTNIIVGNDLKKKGDFEERYTDEKILQLMVEHEKVISSHLKEKVKDLQDDKANLQLTINGLLKAVNLLESKYAKRM